MAQPNNPNPDQGGSQQHDDTRNDIQWQQDDPDQQQRNPDQQNSDSGSDKTMGREQEQKQGNRQNQGDQGNKKNQGGQGDSQGGENR